MPLLSGDELSTAISNDEKPVKQPKPPLRVRLCSWKWWIHGDVEPKPLDRPVKGVWKHVCGMCVFWVVVAGHPWLSTWVNRHPPKFSELEVVHGSVIGTSIKSPHLTIRNSDGVVLAMEYPSFMNTLGSSTEFIRGLGRNNASVLGCDATVWFDVPKYTLWTRYRVWQVLCDDGGAGASYAHISNETAGLGLRLSGFFAFIGLPLIFAFFLTRIRRGYYER